MPASVVPEIIPVAGQQVLGWTSNDISIETEDGELAEKCMKFVDTLSSSNNLLHGDFHTGNVFLQNGEPVLIDMDSMSTGHPIVEISDLYYFYVVLGENDPTVVEDFMGFSYETAKRFFDLFLKYYLETDDENILRDTKEKAGFLCNIRMINKLHKSDNTNEKNRELIEAYMGKLREFDF